MRILMVALVGAAGLAAQGAEADASAKLKQFERNLQNAMRPRGMRVLLQPQRPAESPCAIPLLRVGPDASFKSNMRLVNPDPKGKFFMREVAPPAPSCDDREK